MTRTSYHHGALREALLRATLELIETEGIGAVSLRQVARTAGVSPGAPYHHFPDRAALLTALADEGFRRLATTLAEAHDAAATPSAALEALLTTYIEFARNNPAYFRVMFRPELTQPHKSAEGMAAGESAFGVLDRTVEECLSKNEGVDRHVLAITLWSLAHGYASLWLDGQLDSRTADPAGLAHQIAALVTTFTAPS
ncbi:TetR/AcrR family transcriptional regulator [Actinophytocola sp.]|uniref:TetR/AcrR family transcriptional regulator n=1 Tax=Actinophytocola sp. TaxID=1872138 RepID=UPI002ED531AB